MRWIPTCVAVLMLPVLLLAQDGAKQQPSAQAVYDKLTAELLAQKTAYSAAAKAVQASDAYKAARKAKDSKAIGELMSVAKRPDNAGLAEQAIAAAKTFEGDDAAKLLGWAAVNAGKADIIKSAVGKLTADHIKSVAWVEILEKGSAISRPLGAEATNEVLSKILAESPHDVAKAWALYWQSVALTGRNADEAMQKQGAALLAKAETLAGDHWLADKIRGPRFIEERLQIGMVAPNIVGEDIDGVKFELEDYRGKVVVLDFWGFW